MASDSPADHQGSATTDSRIEPRTKRALTECSTVLDGIGVVRNAADMYLVVSQSGREYIVDAREQRCSCADHERRRVQCKHIRRVQICRGERLVPADIDRDEIDDQLGRHVDATIRWEVPPVAEIELWAEPEPEADDGDREPTEPDHEVRQL